MKNLLLTLISLIALNFPTLNADELDKILETITNPPKAEDAKKPIPKEQSKISPTPMPPSKFAADPKIPNIKINAKKGAENGLAAGKLTSTVGAAAIIGSVIDDIIPLPPDILPEKVSTDSKKTFGISEVINPKEQPIVEEKGKNIPGLEETSIYVMRQIAVKKASGTEWETVRIPIPVYYRTRSVAWGQDQIRTALLIQQRIEEYTKKLDTIKKEGELLLTEYNKVILSGIPQEVLGSDSPSITTETRKDNHVAPLRGKDLSITVEGN